MKILLINEEQYRKLVEGNVESEAPNFEDDIPTYLGSEVSPNPATINKQDGNKKLPNTFNQDKIGHSLITNHWGYRRK